MSVMRIRSNQDSRLPDPTMYRYKRTSVTKGFGNLKKENVNFLYLLNFRIGNLNTRKILLTKNNLVSCDSEMNFTTLKFALLKITSETDWFIVVILGDQSVAQPVR